MLLTAPKYAEKIGHSYNTVFRNPAMLYWAISLSKYITNNFRLSLYGINICRRNMPLSHSAGLQICTTYCKANVATRSHFSSRYLQDFHCLIKLWVLRLKIKTPIHFQAYYSGQSCYVSDMSKWRAVTFGVIQH